MRMSMNNEQRIEEMRRRIEASLKVSRLEIVDDSHRHAGHPGARDGRGHFVARVVSDDFSGQAALARHRMVFAAVGDMMQTDVHALNITALTVAEANDE